jgi:hypothetical protein
VGSQPQSLVGLSSENGDSLHAEPASEPDTAGDQVDSEPISSEQTFADVFGDDALGEVLDELARQGTALGFRRYVEEDVASDWPPLAHADSASAAPLAANANESSDESAGISPAARPAAATGGSRSRGTAARSANPRGISLDRMIAAVRSYVGDELQWDLQLILRKDDTPPIGLGIVGNLGWSSWVIRDNMSYDPNDLVLDAMGAPTKKQQIEFRHVRAWDHATLGQRRDGQYIVATIDTGDLSVVQTTLSS